MWTINYNWLGSELNIHRGFYVRYEAVAYLCEFQKTFAGKDS